MKTDDSPRYGQGHQKGAHDGYEQLELTDVYNQPIIIQQYERLVREHRQQNGGQTEVGYWG